MSATSFRAADLQPAARRLVATARGDAGRLAGLSSSRRVALAVDASLLVIALTAVILMARHPQWATIPYHLLFLSVMLVYGFRVWPVLPTVAVILAITLTTGWLMVDDYLEGGIETPELSEIPLMPALLVAMVWHARRRAAANRALVAMAAQQTSMIERERTFFRDTSHAIRTPVTIARGHLELATSVIEHPVARGDVGVALRQLDRMAVLSNRLLALAQLDSGETPPAERMDMADFVDELGTDWSARSPTALGGREPDGRPPSGPIRVAGPGHRRARRERRPLHRGPRHDLDHGCRQARHVRHRRPGRRSRHRTRGPRARLRPLLAPASAEWPHGQWTRSRDGRATARAWGGDVAVFSRPGQGARFEFSLPRCDV